MMNRPGVTNLGWYYLACLVAGVLGHSAAAFGAEPLSSTNSPANLIVEMGDGSKLVGRISTPGIAIEVATVGRLEVELKRVVVLRREGMQKSMTMTLVNGDQLAGELASAKLHLRTAFGDVVLPREQILSIRVRHMVAGDGVRHRWSGEYDARDGAGTAHGRTGNLVSYGPGRKGRAFVFASDAMGVRFDESVGSFANNDFTLTFWIRSGKRPQIEYVMSKRAACQPVKLWEVRLESDGCIALTMGEVKEHFAAVHLSSRSRVDDSAWHLVAFTRQREEVKVFLDGQPEGAELTPFVFDFTIAAPLILGSGCCAGRAGTTHFGGQLDEVTVYDRALQPAEIDALFRNP